MIDFESNPIFPYTYYDLDVYPSERSYLYQMSVTDSCHNEVAFSNFGQSIFLDGKPSYSNFLIDFVLIP